jgi:RNA recognition motif-containing protein
MSTKLYVGNLPYETTESDLQTLFEGAGQVSTVNLIRDRATGQARGFAFVEMNDVEGARKAISELDKHQYGGRSLTVNEAKPTDISTFANPDLLSRGSGFFFLWRPDPRCHSVVRQGHSVGRDAVPCEDVLQ